MNNIQFILIVSLVIAIIIIAFLILNKSKDTFQDSFSKLQIIEKDGNNRIVNEFTSFGGFQKEIDPNDENKTIDFMKMNNNSSFVFSRKDEDMNNDFSLGIYFKKKNVNAKYDNFITGLDNNGTTKFQVSLDISKIKVTYEDNPIDIPITVADSFTDDFTYLFFKANINGLGNNPPTLDIIIDNKKTTITLNNKLGATDLSLKKFIFGNKDNEETNGFEGLIGKILIYNEIVGNSTMCRYYNCKINCFEPDGTVYIDSVNGCIKDCMRTCNNIEKCQNICVNCEVEGKFWDMEEKKKKCPWIQDIKQEKVLPNAPQIRGFPGDRKVLIEWKRPFDGGSEITNFIVLYYETFNKKSGVNVSISNKNTTDICEYEIKNLKNRTYYDIVVRAVNSKGIGPASNIVTVAPNGNVILNNNRNIFSELEDELQKEIDNTSLDYMCNANNFDSIGHSLDYYDNDMRDIKNYIEKLKK